MQYFHFPIRIYLFNRAMSSAVCVSDESRFKQSDVDKFVCGGS
jgi:hypothetical protein